MADLRTALEEAMNQAEEGTLEAPVEKEIVEEPVDTIAEEKYRDEKGRFVSQEKEEVSAIEASSEPTEQSEIQPEIEAKPEIKRPNTWKKEYVQIWDKMEKGEQISKEDFIKFAEYANQRESEYAKGVSTYKAEADNALQLRQAIDPFIPDLQRRNINPAQYINNLAKADQLLSHGTYEQKVAMFHRLAQDYGIQLNQESGQFEQQDPYTQQLMQQLQMMNQEVSTIKSRYEQEENARLMGEIQRVSSDVENYPHFESVREQMAQLLERGLANDLKSAYEKAVRLNDEVWAQEQQRLVSQAAKQQSSAQQVAKAKSAAVSVRSVTPKGTASSGEIKDRKSLLAEQLGAAMDNRV